MHTRHCAYYTCNVKSLLNVPKISHISRKTSQVSRFPAKSPDSRNKFVFLPKQRLLELLPPVTIQSSLPHNKIGQYKANIILISVRKSERSRTPTHPSIIKYLLQVGGMVYCVWKLIEWLYAYKLHSWMSWMRDTHGLCKLNLGKTSSQGQVWCILSWKKKSSGWLTYPPWIMLLQRK